MQGGTPCEILPSVPDSEAAFRRKMIRLASGASRFHQLPGGGTQSRRRKCRDVKGSKVEIFDPPRENTTCTLDISARRSMNRTGVSCLSFPPQRHYIVRSADTFQRRRRATKCFSKRLEPPCISPRPRPLPCKAIQSPRLYRRLHIVGFLFCYACHTELMPRSGICSV